MSEWNFNVDDAPDGYYLTAINHPNDGEIIRVNLRKNGEWVWHRWTYALWGEPASGPPPLPESQMEAVAKALRAKSLREHIDALLAEVRELEAD